MSRAPPVAINAHHEILDQKRFRELSRCTTERKQIEIMRCTDDDNWDIGKSMRAQILEQRITPHARHHEIKNDDVGWLGLDLLDRPPTGMDNPNRIALIHEALRNQDRNRDIVINDEHIAYVQHRPALGTAYQSCAEPCVGRA